MPNQEVKDAFRVLTNQIDASRKNHWDIEIKSWWILGKSLGFTDEELATDYLKWPNE